ncbi:PucR family transcriptional regulator [Nocardioides sediminis]|uniref:PucR family transcriptional regulator n=1 Tax=Nocardioides sediminis TaxID=433648 RepID=UPI00131F4770|nr:helix-turn-helix domain-containing protein [Nocardioides sediminis]
MSVRQQVQQRIMADLPTTVDTLVAAVTDEIPAYRALAPEQLDEVGAIAGWATARILDLWVRGTALDAADLNRFKGIGAARAMDGRPLPVVLRAYRVAAARAIDLVVERGENQLAVDDVMALTRLWLASVDALSEALYTGYTAAAQRMTGDHQRALADFLDDLLDGRQATAAALGDRSMALGVTLPSPPAILVVEAGAPMSTITQPALEDLIMSLVEPGGPGCDAERPRVLTALRGSRGVALLPHELTARVHGELEQRRLRGCLIELTDLTQTPAAHRLATDALALAPDRAFTDRAVLLEGDAQVLALLAARPTADPARVTATVLGSVTRPGSEHLIEGLDAYLRTGSAAEGAATLHLHPQTMRYRLRRIVTLTGRDPRRPWDRFVLETARTATHR